MQQLPWTDVFAWVCRRAYPLQSPNSIAILWGRLSAARRTEQDDVQRLLRESVGKGDSQRFALGALCFGGLLFTAGAAPWALPYLYLLFIACAVPWRAWDFSRKKGAFFLLDFCYVSLHQHSATPGVQQSSPCTACMGAKHSHSWKLEALSEAC